MQLHLIILSSLVWRYCDSVTFVHGGLDISCQNQTCVRKCCQENEVYFNKTCVPSQNSDFAPVVYDGKVRFEENVTFRVIHNMTCGPERRRYKLGPNDWFYLQKNGDLHGSDVNVTYEDFCLDTFVSLNNESTFTAAVCYELGQVIAEEIQPGYVVGMIISMPFLLATFVVYALIPERNLHQKALMFYVLTLLIAYICLVSTQLSGQIPPALCTTAGFLVLFFFLVSVFWMNVICIDIWFTFSGSRGFIGNSKSSEMKRFLLYCLYAWGVPILFIIVTFFINEFSDSNSNFHPNIGVRSCFLGAELPYLIYFYGPMALIIIANIVLFTLTALKIRQVKKETSMLKHSDSQRHTYEKNKQKFTLYVKLMLAMGVNWSMEVISWAVKWGLKKTPEEIWYLTDLCNALYGVFIFFIFVFKRKIWTMLKKRYYTFIGKPHLAQSLTSTQVTRTSNFSSSVTESHHDENSVRRRPEEIALNRRT